MATCNLPGGLFCAIGVAGRHLKTPKLTDGRWWDTRIGSC